MGYRVPLSSLCVTKVSFTTRLLSGVPTPGHGLQQILRGTTLEVSSHLHYILEDISADGRHGFSRLSGVNLKILV